jgi:hypothetical protein
MKKLLMIAAALVALTMAADAKDLTCRGEYADRGGSLSTIGEPEDRFCYLVTSEAQDAVAAACQPGQSCTVRAKVARRDTPNGMPQTYNVVQVYSAQAEVVPLPRPRP